jgi:hypothetical protein
MNVLTCSHGWMAIRKRKGNDINKKILRAMIELSRVAAGIRETLDRCSLEKYGKCVQKERGEYIVRSSISSLLTS